MTTPAAFTCTAFTRTASRRQLLARGAAAAAALVLPALARANAPFPSRPLTLVLPFPPGGSFDPLLRALSTAAAKELGQPIVMMHKPGAGGVTGTAGLAAMDDTDGHTLAVMHNSVLRYPFTTKVTWDPLKDFQYVLGLAEMTSAVCVAATSPWQRFGELLADAKRRPGELSWGNVGAISAYRIQAERTARAAGARFNMIPFKGGGEAFTALIGGHLDVYGDPGFGAMARGGKVRLLATMTEQRLPRWPEVPTLKELGHDTVVQSVIGLVVPRRTDPAAAQRLAAAFRGATEDADYRRMLDEYDMTPRVLAPDAFRAYAVAQVAREKALLDSIGFKPE